MSVAARALSIAARPPPSLGGALVLAALSTVPWVEPHQRSDAPIVTASGSPELGFESDPIVIPWDLKGSWNHRDALEPQPYDVIVPPNLRDARPYPEGMVMGLGVPSVDPGIVVWDGPPPANMLSVILVPLRALAGLAGT